MYSFFHFPFLWQATFSIPCLFPGAGITSLHLSLPEESHSKVQTVPDKGLCPRPWVSALLQEILGMSEPQPGGWEGWGSGVGTPQILNPKSPIPAQQHGAPWGLDVRSGMF